MSTGKRENGSSAAALLKRDIRFWGRSSMEGIAVSVGAALILFLFNGVGQAEDMNLVLQALPYYLFGAGGFAVFMVSLSYFQTYFPMLVSMNATRSSVMRGILLSEAVQILLITAIGGLIWKVVPGDMSRDGLSVLPLIIGILFFTAAFCIILGAVMIRWGKTGTIITVVIAAGIGAAVGFTVALSDGTEMFRSFFESLLAMKVSAYLTVLAIGLGAYVLAGIFAAVLTRKIEARV